jgi:hypothetical protein
MVCLIFAIIYAVPFQLLLVSFALLNCALYKKEDKSAPKEQTAKPAVPKKDNTQRSKANPEMDKAQYDDAKQHLDMTQMDDVKRSKSKSVKK